MAIREPKCCLNCSTVKAIKEYEGKSAIGRFLQPMVSKIKGLVLMEKSGDLMWLCKKCGYGRPIETKEPLWWVDCPKCNVKSISPQKDKCINCDIGV